MPEQDKEKSMKQKAIETVQEGALDDIVPSPQTDPPQGAAAINPGIILPPIIIAAFMALLLGLVYGVTKEPIAEAKRLDKQNKLKEVMPEFDNDVLAAETQLSESVTIYTGKQGGETSGYGVTSSVTSGYSGYFSCVLGINADGTVNKVRILESAETPGLGSKAGEPEWLAQFEGQQLGSFEFKVSKDGGDVDTITGATITSRAVTDCVRNGLDAYESADLDSAAAGAGSAGETQLEEQQEDAGVLADDLPPEGGFGNTGDEDGEEDDDEEGGEGNG